MNNDFFENNQFVVSHELLQLLKWLLEHEQETLKRLIAKSLKNGLYFNISTPINKHEENSELQHSLIDFFIVMENILYEIIDKEEVQKLLQRNLIPAINQIDAASYDNSTLALSVAKASSLYENNPKQNPKDILCKELLKRWKPRKNSAN